MLVLMKESGDWRSMIIETFGKPFGSNTNYRNKKGSF